MKDNMKKDLILCLSALMMLIIGISISSCSSSDDEKDNNTVITPILLVGEWSASHQNMNPDYADTCDMWPFSFKADGTGFVHCTQQFRYELKGNHIVLHYQAQENVCFVQLDFEYEIASVSKDRMEWYLIDSDSGNRMQHLVFYR
jgi:hypothetical protein